MNFGMQSLLRLRLTQKALQLSFQLFFLFFFLVPFSGRPAKNFLANVLRLLIQKACDQDLTHSLDTPKIIFVKIVSQVVIRDACGTRHGLCTATIIHSIQKCARNSQKLGNMLANWQMAADSRVKTKRNRVDKERLKKKKKMFKID